MLNWGERVKEAGFRGVLGGGSIVFFLNFRIRYGLRGGMVF